MKTLGEVSFKLSAVVIISWYLILSIHFRRLYENFYKTAFGNDTALIYSGYKIVAANFLRLLVL